MTGHTVPTFYPQQALRRRVGERPRRKHTDPRTPFAKDRDRILYARSFRRLSGKSQVAASTEIEPFHTRLTHSLKVAQLGRRLAENLRAKEFEIWLTQGTHADCGDTLDHIDTVDDKSLFRLLAPDPDLVEFACLAHDIGHPPFGHTGERELHATVNRLIDECIPMWPKRIKALVRRKVGGFEGNPQTLRIITRLAHIAHGEEPEFRETSKPQRLGLNLTAAAIDATSKYPFKLANLDQGKWGAYGEPSQANSDCGTLEWARKLLNRHVMSTVAVSVNEYKECQSFECQIMDWCDDVTYAVHDVEDFYMAGIIPLDLIFDDGKITKWRSSGETRSFDLHGLHEHYHDYYSNRNPKDPSTTGEVQLGATDFAPSPSIKFHSTEWERFRRFVKEKWNRKGRRTMNGEPRVITDADLDRLRAKLVGKFAFANSSSEPMSIKARQLSHSRTNSLITYFTQGVRCSGKPLLHQGKLMLADDDNDEQDLRDQCDLLKELIWKYVIESPGLATQQAGQRRVIRELIEMHIADPELLPHHYRELLETGTVGCEDIRGIAFTGIDLTQIAKIRLAADYVSSLSEPHAIALHTRLTGVELGRLRDFV